MKNKVIVTACALLAMTTASAQNAYDAEKLLGNDLNGTHDLLVWVVPWELWAVIYLS